MLAGITLLLAIAIPLAPVIADDPVISWPRAGEAATDTVLPLSPYRPLQLDATVPCSALQQVGSGEALRTMPADAGPNAANQGLLVAVDGGQTTITASGRVLLQEPVPAGDCSYHVAAGADGLHVSRDGTQLVDMPDLIVPQVAQLVTDTPQAAGLSVTLHTDDRYSSSPTVLKGVLLVLHLCALTALLVFGWRRWRGDEVSVGRPKLSWPDVLVVVVSVAWVGLSPYNFDDSWYLLMARNAGEAGYIGNYIYMFNATENPFVVSQYVMQVWGEIGGWGLTWMRVLPLIYGLVTWVLLRLLLHSALGRITQAGWVPWALLVAHLVWWLPYEMSLRPEPMIVMFGAAVLLFAEIGRRRRSVGAMALATACAVLAVACSPSGIVAAAPLLLALPWLWRWLQGADRASRTGAILLALAAATVLVPVGFADATLGDVRESFDLHQWYYLTVPWYNEFTHYQTLLDNRDTAWGRRAGVVFAIALLLVVAIASGRSTPNNDPLRRLLYGSALATAVSLALLALTPTKWVNHFGAIAAAPTVLLACALLRSPLPRSSGYVARVAAVIFIGFGAVLTFAAPNIWRPYSDRGQPFGNHLEPDPTMVQIAEQAPHIGSFYLRNPFLWFGLGALIGLWLWWRRRHGRATRMTPERGVLIAASVTVVLLMVSVFTYAPLKQYPGWTLASSAAQAVTGNPCGLATNAQALLPSDRELGPPTGEVEREGAFEAAAPHPSPVPAPAGEGAWHSALPGGVGVGQVRSAWYPIPPGAGSDSVTVPVVGDGLELHHAEVEFASGDPASPTPVGAAPLPINSALPPNTWHESAVPVAPEATLVRVVAHDGGHAPDSWLALGEPRLTSWQPVSNLTSGQVVFADQLSAALWPCENQAAIADGVAQAAAVRLLADEALPPILLINHVYPDWGGTFVQADRTATYVRLTSRLEPSGPPTPPWGAVERVIYDHPVGQVDKEVRTVRRAGWTRLPTLAGEPYTGRVNIG